MEGLRYGGYFCHEDVGVEGFLCDDHYYYFRIDEDSQTMCIGNRLGVGSVNTPIYGELEITKLDSANSPIFLMLAFVSGISAEIS